MSFSWSRTYIPQPSVKIPRLFSLLWVSCSISLTISPAFSVCFLIPPCCLELRWLEQHIVPTVWVHWHLIKWQCVSCLVLSTLPDDVQHFIGFFGCYPTLNWWLQGSVNGNSKISSLSYNFSVHIVQTRSLDYFYTESALKLVWHLLACSPNLASCLWCSLLLALHFIAQKEDLENSLHASYSMSLMKVLYKTV